MLVKTRQDHRAIVLEQCNELVKKIKKRRFDLIELLSHYETFDTANDEIERSLETLQGIAKEFSSIKKPLNDLTIATFFPLNLPLYSLVLFGIAPSAFAKHVFIRPPEVMVEILQNIYGFLNVSHHFPNVSLHPLPRKVFMDLYASDADIVIFTGKYENALDIQAKCPQALLIYNGSGINPFVIFKGADIDLAVSKAVEMRCFNSGQDCAGPDAFFVPSNISDQFIGKLQEALKSIKVGDSKDPDVKISRTIKESYLQQLSVFLEKESAFQIYGGEINHDKGYVYPTIIKKNLSQHSDNFHEFFAPVFYVLSYSRLGELEKTIRSPAFKKRTMYISVFGDNPRVEEKLPFATILKNQIVNDVERGNYAYGGGGSQSNFLLYGDEKIVQPVLISRDIHDTYKKSGLDKLF